MSIDLENFILVKELAGSRISISNYSNNFQKELNDLGFHLFDANYQLDIQPENYRSKSQLILKLIELDALFVRGKEWSPAEFIEYLRDDKKLLSKPFLEIVWTNPSSFIIRKS